MESTGVILIADDNENNLRVLSTMLREEDYTVRVATNGLQVLRSVGASKPDLILLDIHMPEMDGYTTCEKLKADPMFNEIPVIFISALTETFNKVKAFETGAVDYITKPFQVEEVKMRVRTHLLLRRRSLELENAIADLKSVQLKLVEAEKMASLGVLSAGIAHEINNPINFVYAGVNSLIKNFNELQKAMDAVLQYAFQCPEAAKEINAICDKHRLPERLNTIPMLANDIKTGAQRTTEIVKGLRLFTRSDQEEKALSNVVDSMEAALLLLKNQYKSKAEIIRQYDENIPAIKCYPGQLTQALVNILHNAIDAIKDKGTITISLQHHEPLLLICISDTGSGIPDHLVSKIFDPFFTTKAVGGGMGLGLSITHGIIGKHEGTIRVESKVGSGTSFFIELPTGF
ncbi:MAG: response regulator receiver [Bacteroidetes bacterium]|nr:MAG: response regulator receiver [Bacteroidota bacterium]